MPRTVFVGGTVIMFRVICILFGVIAFAGCAAGALGEPTHPTAGELVSYCAGIGSSNIAADLRPDVDRVETVREPSPTKPVIDRTVGADIHVLARPGMTAEYLTRLLDCESARETGSVLATPGSTHSVTSSGNGFTIALRSNDGDVARGLARRAQAWK